MSEPTSTKKNTIPDHIALMSHEIQKLAVVDPVKATSGDPETAIYQSMLPTDLSPDQVNRVRIQDRDFGLALKHAIGQVHIKNMAESGNQANSMKGTFNMLGGKEAVVVTKRSSTYSAAVGSTNPDDKVTYWGTTRLEFNSDMGSNAVVDSITTSLRDLGKELLGNAK